MNELFDELDFYFDHVAVAADDLGDLLTLVTGGCLLLLGMSVARWVSWSVECPVQCPLTKTIT